MDGTTVAPLDWHRLSPVARRERWLSLAAWVEWLVDAYDPWIKLPDCWPRHESLRSELASFQAWHDEILRSGTGYDGTYWHAQLRTAASAWEELEHCRHEETPWRAGRTSSPASREHLDIAMRETTSGPGSTGRPPLPKPVNR